MLKIVAQKTIADCSIAALATYLGLKYRTVHRAAETVVRKPAERGMYMTQILRTAAVCGRSLRLKEVCDFDEDEGVLSVDNYAKYWSRKKGRPGEHVVVLWRGLIFDPDGPNVWTPGQYRAANKAKFRSILVPK